MDPESLLMGFSMWTLLWASLGSLMAWWLISKIGIPRGPSRHHTACYELASKITRHRSATFYSTKAVTAPHPRSRRNKFYLDWEWQGSRRLQGTEIMAVAIFGKYNWP